MYLKDCPRNTFVKIRGVRYYICTSDNVPGLIACTNERQDLNIWLEPYVVVDP